MKLLVAIILAVAVILVGLALLRQPQLRQVTGQRIVSLSPAITEILFELGLGGQIVGTSEYSDYPPAAKQIPQVAKYGDPNIELILQTKPDLVIGQEIGPGKNKLLKTQLAPTCQVLLLKTDTLEDILTATEDIAEATGTKQRGRELLDAWRKTIARLEKRYADLAEKDRPRVYVDLGTDLLQTCGSGTYFSQMIRLAGGKNLGDAAGALWPIVNSETVVVWNPQLILVLGMRPGSDFKKRISARLSWNNIDAVKTGRIIVLGDEFNRQGPRLFEAAEELAQIIAAQHPRSNQGD